MLHLRRKSTFIKLMPSRGGNLTVNAFPVKLTIYQIPLLKVKYTIVKLFSNFFSNRAKNKQSDLRQFYYKYFTILKPQKESEQTSFETSWKYIGNTYIRKFDLMDLTPFKTLGPNDGLIIKYTRCNLLNTICLPKCNIQY